MGIAVTVTGEGVGVDGAVTIRGRDGFVVELDELSKSIKALQSAGMMSKAEKAERVVLVIKDVLVEMASEVADLRAELVRIKRHGFGG